MRSTFSLRHMLVFALTLCLISVVAGAALAQDEPGSPEPVVPVFDLTGSSDEAVAEPAAVAPVVIVPAVTGETVDGPNGVITTTDPEWTVNADGADGPAFINLSLYAPGSYYIDPETGEITFYGAPIGQTSTAVTDLTSTGGSRITFSASAFVPMDVLNTPAELLDGFRYAWWLTITDNSGTTEPVEGVFTIDVPLVSPTLTGTTIINTTPLITWPADPNIAWYEIASVADDPATAEEFDVVSWYDFYPAEDNNEDYGNPRYSEGICENDQCKVRPYQSISYSEDFSEFVDGDFGAQIWVQTYDANFEIVNEWDLLTEFNVVAPDVNVDADAGVTEGRPQFTVTPTEQVVDELPGVGLLGLTQAVKPDYYYVFLIPGDDVLDTFDYPDGFAAEWYYVGAPDVDGVQTLWPWDGEQDLLYNGTWSYWVQGYVSALDAYTNWTLGGTVVIDAAPPVAEELVFAGIYESVGGPALDPYPWALTSTWVPASLTSVESNRPLFHIAPNVQDTDWVNIIVYSNEEGVVYDNWFNVNDELDSSDDSDEYWYCGANFGGFFEGVTCFFQLPDVLDTESGGLIDGMAYQLYGAAYGPGGFSTGGIFGSGYTDPEDSPAADFELAGPDALDGLGVSVTGEPTPFTSTGAFPGGFTQTRITGEPRFYWQQEDTATYYYYQINDGQDDTVDFSGTWWFADDVSCSGDICATYVEDYLPNGTYTAVFAYWNGGFSDAASVEFTIDNDDASLPEAITDTLVVYAEENLTGTTSPVFQWDHVDGNTWYIVEVEQGGETVYVSEWTRALDICYYTYVSTEGTWPDYVYNYEQRCRLSDSDLYIDTFNGPDFTWTVSAWSSSEGAIATSGPADFTLEDIATGEPKPVYPMTETTLTYTVEPTFYFEPGENAAWYFVYFGNEDETVIADWYYISQDNRTSWSQYYNNSVCYDSFFNIDTGPGNDDIPVAGPLCAFGLNSDELLLVNGDYEWWMLPWGPAGYVDNDLDGWVFMANVTVDIPAPEPVSDFGYPAYWTVTDLNSVNWYGSAGAMWYNVKIVDTASEEVVFEEWAYFEDACGLYGIPDFGSSPFSEFCGIDIEDDSFLSEWGVFEVVIHAWGQGTSFFGGDEDNYFNATAPEFVPTFTKL